MVLVGEQGGGKWFVPFFDIFLQLQTAKWSGPQGREQKGSEGHTGLLRADLKGGRRWGGGFWPPWRELPLSDYVLQVCGSCGFRQLGGRGDVMVMRTTAMEKAEQTLE